MSPDRGVFQRLGELEPHRVQPGLARIQAICDRLGSPQLTYPTVIVAGTNGKGSVAAMLSSIGLAAGLRVGCYTSPHLSAVEERFRVDGFPISTGGLGRHLTTVFDAADELLASGSMDQPPSHFEVLTAAAFVYFREANVDLGVFEVGLGGRWDATNVVRPRLAIVTPIALEHTDWLGDDLRSIAAEKAAVIPRSGIVVLAPQEDEVGETVLERAAEVQAVVWDWRDHPVTVRGTDARLRVSFDMVGRSRSYGGLQLSLPGHHQVDNARCAVLAAEALARKRLHIGSDAIWAGLRRVEWPGRCEWIGERPAVLLDGAHNPAAAAALAHYLEALREAGAYERLHLVVGVLRDKDAGGIVAALGPLADRAVVTEPPTERARPADELAAVDGLPEERAVEPDPEHALRRALQAAGERDLVCVAGSIYLVGRLRDLLLGSRSDVGTTESAESEEQDPAAGGAGGDGRPA